MIIMSFMPTSSCHALANPWRRIAAGGWEILKDSDCFRTFARSRSPRKRGNQG
jgi:hypothetical protein